MNRQTIIRGVAIACAGISASIFAAKEMLMTGADAPQHAQAAQPENVQGLRSASLLGGGSVPASAAAPSFDAQSDDAPLALVLEEEAPAPRGPIRQIASPGPAPADGPVLTLSALDLSDGTDGAAPAANDIRPDHSLASAEPVTTRDIIAEMDFCAPVLTLEPMTDALIDLRLEAPCHPLERVVISHGDLAFSALTSADGRFSTYVPALAETASVDLFLPDDTFLQGTVEIADFQEHHRVIIQWSGDAALSLHAYHRGAAHGEAGHLSESMPFDPENDQSFLISLGEKRGIEPMLAQVHSFPVLSADKPRLELEIQHDTQRCGHDLTAYILQSGPGLAGELVELTLALPECDVPAGLVILPLPLDVTTDAPLASSDVPDTALDNI